MIWKDRIQKVSLADETGCSKEAEAFIGDTKNLTTILSIFQQFFSCIHTEKKRPSFAVSPCDCQTTPRIPNGSVLLCCPDECQLECTRCGKMCDLITSVEIRCVSAKMHLALTAIEYLACSEAFGLMMVKHAHLLVNIVESNEVSFALRANAIGALLPLGRLVKDFHLILRVLGLYLRKLVDLELAEQYKYCVTSLMLASTILQQHGAPAARRIMEHQQGIVPPEIAATLDEREKCNFSDDKAALLPSVIGVLLMQHSHQIMQFGMGCGSSSEDDIQIQNFRDQHDDDQRPLIVCLAFDFFEDLFLAGVEVWREVKIPARGHEGTYAFVTFKEAMMKYVEALLKLAEGSRNNKLKRQILVLSGDVPPTAHQSSKEVCNSCGKAADLKVCSRCRVVKYCSPECQKNDYRWHRKTCTALVADAAAYHASGAARILS